MMRALRGTGTTERAGLWRFPHMKALCHHTQKAANSHSRKLTCYVRMTSEPEVVKLTGNAHIIEVPLAPRSAACTSLKRHASQPPRTASYFLCFVSCLGRPSQNQWGHLWPFRNLSRFCEF